VGQIFNEGIRLYLVEGRALSAPAYLLLFLGLVQCLMLFFPSIELQGWTGAAQLFKVSAIAALVLLPYFTVRLANQEYDSWRFVSLKSYFQEHGLSWREVAGGQLALLLFFAASLLLVSAPLLAWAGAISRVSPATIFAVLFLLWAYGCVVGVWGLVGVALWEHQAETRQVFARCMLGCLLFLSALLYLPLSPVAFLLALSAEAQFPAPGAAWQRVLSPVWAHFGFWFAVLCLGLWSHSAALRRRARA
jgi:hypothetical protein